MRMRLRRPHPAANLSRWAATRLFERLQSFWRRARAVRPNVVPDFLDCDDDRSPRSKTIPKEGERRKRTLVLIGNWGILPADLRWREWMMRVEAVIFASAEPVSRETLARVVGKDCSIDLLIDDLVEELRSRPYELVSVAGGWQHRTPPSLRGR